MSHDPSGTAALWALDAALSAGTPDVAWGQASTGTWQVGMGAAEVLTGTDHADGWAAMRQATRSGHTWLGGASFSDATDDGWAAMGAFRWVRPEQLWTQAGERRSGPDLPVRSPATHRNRVVQREENRALWDRVVNLALDAFSSGELAKVVLARTVDVTLERDVDVGATVRWLAVHYPSTHVFLHRSPDGGAFLGATPETLCRVEGTQVTVDALAGTAAHGTPFLPKERHEHAVVVEDIRSRLLRACTDVNHPDAPLELTLPNLRHLYTPIRATLRDGFSSVDVALGLHPTPAVGGFPRAGALAFQAANEGFARGWYAGPVGVIQPGLLHLNVALRCARVKGNRARLYVGAGLVAGSNAAAEWDETERKASVMLNALCGGPP